MPGHKNSFQYFKAHNFLATRYTQQLARLVYLVCHAIGSIRLRCSVRVSESDLDIASKVGLSPPGWIRRGEIFQLMTVSSWRRIRPLRNAGVTLLLIITFLRIIFLKRHGYELSYFNIRLRRRSVLYYRTFYLIPCFRIFRFFQRAILSWRSHSQCPVLNRDSNHHRTPACLDHNLRNTPQSRRFRRLQWTHLTRRRCRCRCRKIPQLVIIR